MPCKTGQNGAQNADRPAPRRAFSSYMARMADSAYGARSVPARLTRKDSPIRTTRVPRNGNGNANGGRAPLSVVLYETAQAESAYGTPQLGDLFNDIMGAVVPGWDDRPQWMKDIKVKPDPKKIIEQATKVVPPKQVKKVVETAEQAGVNIFYQTPAGDVPVTGYLAEQMYGNYPVLAKARQAAGALGDVPWYVWAGGGTLLLLMLTRR